MKKGKFIALEGIDGSGKSTQIKLLDERLKGTNIPYHITRECSDGPIGKLIRSQYLSGNRKVDERVLNVLFTADRLDHITNEIDGIMKFINNGINVICDRFYLSSLAYDTYMYIKNETQYQEKLMDIFKRNSIIRELIIPDITIYIEVPTSMALSRIHEGRELSSISIYEDLEKLDKISASYKRCIKFLKESENENIKIISGNDSIYKVNEQIWNEINDILSI